MASLVLNVGNCKNCQDTIEVGKKWQKDVRHNCNNCGYYQSYNEKLIIIKRGIVTEVY
jgi:DNA-directed RNA polymerase subunit M/transcription elongation factor TFIIS